MIIYPSFAPTGLSPLIQFDFLLIGPPVYPVYQHVHLLPLSYSSSISISGCEISLIWALPVGPSATSCFELCRFLLVPSRSIQAYDLSSQMTIYWLMLGPKCEIPSNKTTSGVENNPNESNKVAKIIATSSLMTNPHERPKSYHYLLQQQPNLNQIYPIILSLSFQTINFLLHLPFNLS